jgi:hypothetical protein
MLPRIRLTIRQRTRTPSSGQKLEHRGRADYRHGSLLLTFQPPPGTEADAIVSQLRKSIPLSCGSRDKI